MATSTNQQKSQVGDRWPVNGWDKVGGASGGMGAREDGGVHPQQLGCDSLWDSCSADFLWPNLGFCAGRWAKYANVLTVLSIRHPFYAGKKGIAHELPLATITKVETFRSSRREEQSHLRRHSSTIPPDCLSTNHCRCPPVNHTPSPLWGCVAHSPAPTLMTFHTLPTAPPIHFWAAPLDAPPLPTPRRCLSWATTISRTSAASVRRSCPPICTLWTSRSTRSGVHARAGRKRALGRPWGPLPLVVATHSLGLCWFPRVQSHPPWCHCVCPRMPPGVPGIQVRLASPASLGRCCIRWT